MREVDLVDWGGSEERSGARLVVESSVEPANAARAARLGQRKRRRAHGGMVRVQACLRP